MIKNLIESALLFVISSAIASISIAQEIDTTGLLNPDKRAHLDTQSVKYTEKT